MQPADQHWDDSYWNSYFRYPQGEGPSTTPGHDYIDQDAHSTSTNGLPPSVRHSFIDYSGLCEYHVPSAVPSEALPHGAALPIALLSYEALWISTVRTQVLLQVKQDPGLRQLEESITFGVIGAEMGLGVPLKAVWRRTDQEISSFMQDAFTPLVFRVPRLKICIRVSLFVPLLPNKSGS